MARGTTVRTPERVAEAVRLRGEGKKLREIADHFGVSPKTASEWVTDPDQATWRRRRAAYAVVCTVCGARIANGSKEADPDEPVCQSCAPAHYATWPREAVIASIQGWAAQHGRQPGAEDFRRDKRAGRDLPSVNHVKYTFGTWQAGLDAAGFPRRRGGPEPGFVWLTADQRRECARRYAAGESSVDIAADLHCAPRTCLKWARHYGVEIRPNFTARAAA